MKKKNEFSLFNMDERNRLVAYRIIAIMYFSTITAITGIVLYRQFGLHQEIEQFEDLAIIMTVNSLFLISALLFFGAIPFQKIRIRTILLGYLVFVILGCLFTYFKYNVFQEPGLSWTEFFDKMIIVASVTGLMVVFFILMQSLGKWKADREIID
jgi:hypothetical protein